MVYGIFENTLISARKDGCIKVIIVQHLCNISFNKKIKEKILFKIYAYTERKLFNVVYGASFSTLAQLFSTNDCEVAI